MKDCSRSHFTFWISNFPARIPSLEIRTNYRTGCAEEREMLRFHFLQYTCVRSELFYLGSFYTSSTRSTLIDFFSDSLSRIVLALRAGAPRKAGRSIPGQRLKYFRHFSDDTFLAELRQSYFLPLKSTYCLLSSSLPFLGSAYCSSVIDGRGLSHGRSILYHKTCGTQTCCRPDRRNDSWRMTRARARTCIKLGISSTRSY